MNKTILIILVVGIAVMTFFAVMASDFFGTATQGITGNTGQTEQQKADSPAVGSALQLMKQSQAAQQQADTKQAEMESNIRRLERENSGDFGGQTSSRRSSSSTSDADRQKVRERLMDAAEGNNR